MTPDEGHAAAVRATVAAALQLTPRQQTRFVFDVHSMLLRVTLPGVGNEAQTRAMLTEVVRQVRHHMLTEP